MILRQVEIVGILMPIFFAQSTSMLSFGHYEMKASEAKFPWVNIDAVDIRSVTISCTCFLICFQIC